MTLKEYQELAGRTMPTVTLYELEFHALFGLVGEIGELHSIYQKKYQGHTGDTEEHRKKELGDLLWFAAEYCASQGWSLDEIARLNIDKLKARYPKGFESERSLHRAEGDI
jgi:NTP pyrophosphatase (non-canonical NTP hydrolase)